MIYSAITTLQGTDHKPAYHGMFITLKQRVTPILYPAWLKNNELASIGSMSNELVSSVLAGVRDCIMHLVSSDLADMAE